MENKSMQGYLQKIATGPEMSRDLSYEEAEHGMQLVLNGEVDDVQAAVFLIALRMKRETDEEMQGVLAAVRNACLRETVAVDLLLDISDPFDGFLRHVPASPFLPAVLAACGVPTVIHGVDNMGPKYGLTMRKVYQQCGINVNLTPQQAKMQIEDGNISWAYLDQAAYNPKLYHLKKLRRQIVKRPCITTIEGMVGPLVAQGETHRVQGYVHKNYRDTYPMLARSCGYQSMLLLRGIEGGISPLLNRPVECLHCANEGKSGDGEINIEKYDPIKYDPIDIGIKQKEKAMPLPEDIRARFKDKQHTEEDVIALAKITAAAGLAALNGEAGLLRDSLVFSAAIYLFHLKKVDSFQSAADSVRSVLDNGDALQRFKHHVKYSER